MLKNLAKAKAQIIETSRLAGVAEVATSIIHNAGNLLNSINVSVSLLQQSTESSMMTEVVEPTPYMQAKGIQVHSGVYTDEEKKLTCIPAIDCEGTRWTVQYISEDGTKRFAKDSKKEGCFHVVGGLEKLADVPVIIIAEGYATAETIKEACELPAVVSAFDSGNLKAAAKALHEKYPRTPVIMVADDGDFAAKKHRVIIFTTTY